MPAKPGSAPEDKSVAEPLPPAPRDDDPQETAEWLDGLEYVIQSGGPQRAAYLLGRRERWRIECPRS